MECPNCGNTLVSRLKEYKDYDNKIQWQDQDKTKAHFDKNGNCKGQENAAENFKLKSGDVGKGPNYTGPSSLDETVDKIFAMVVAMYQDYLDRKEN